MRGLALDFPGDAPARTIADQYLFGKSILVAPVTAYGATSREVYLPGKTVWYNAWTGEVLKAACRGRWRRRSIRSHSSSKPAPSSPWAR